MAETTRPGWRWRVGSALLVALAVLAVRLSDAAREPAARAYTPEQLAAGRQVYVTSCARCHGDHGEGGGPDEPDAPFVIGPRALAGFRDAQELYDYVSGTMPNDAPGSLSEEQYWNVLAWLLAKNGLDDPGTLLDPTTAPGVNLRR